MNKEDIKEILTYQTAMLTQLFELQKDINERINNIQSVIKENEQHNNYTFMVLGTDIQKNKIGIIDMKNELRITHNKVSDILEELE